MSLTLWLGFWVCYELAFDFAQLYRAYVAAAPTPASASLKRNRKSK
jgi:hypothetical protein